MLPNAELTQLLLTSLLHPGSQLPACIALRSDSCCTTLCEELWGRQHTAGTGRGTVNTFLPLDLLLDTLYAPSREKHAHLLRYHFSSRGGQAGGDLLKHPAWCR